MQISPDLVQWNEVCKRAESGTLQDDLYEIEDDENWADNQCTWINDSFIQYCQIGEAIDCLVPNLNWCQRRKYQNSLSLIFNEACKMPRELGDALDQEYFVASISPETIKTLITNFEKIDTNYLLSKFENLIDSNLQKDIGEPKENFLGYIEQWISLLKEANAKNMGILIHVG